MSDDSVKESISALRFNTHFNHPDEITGPSSAACVHLADAGIPVGCQTLLLKGVNEDPAVMHRLMNGLLGIRVRPYFLHQLDRVRGTGHFHVPVFGPVLAGLRYLPNAI